MERGDIILIEFPFTDFVRSKIRPAIVISLIEEDICVAFISSQIPQNLRKTDYIVSSGSHYFNKTGLKTDSNFRMNKVATISKKLIIGKIGIASKELQQILDEKLRIAFSLNQ